MAEKEEAEAAVIADYLPEQLTDAEVAALVTAAVEQTGAAEEGMQAMEGEGVEQRRSRAGPTGLWSQRRYAASSADGRPAAAVPPPFPLPPGPLGPFGPFGGLGLGTEVTLAPSTPEG